MIRKTLRRGQTIFVIDFRDSRIPGGRYRKDAQSRTLYEASLEEANILANLEQYGAPEPPPPPPKMGALTLAEFWEQKYEPLALPAFTEGTRMSYISRYLRRGTGLRALLGHVPLGDLEKLEPIMKARNAILATKREPRPTMILLRSVITFATKLKMMTAFPFPEGLYQDSEHLPSATSHDDVRLLLPRAEGWLQRALVLSLYCGLRSGEVRAVRRLDIDLRDRLVSVRRNYSEMTLGKVKSRKERAVPLSDEAFAWLAPALEPMSPDALVCAHEDGSPLGRQEIWTGYNRLRLRLGLPQEAYHLTRHFFVSQLVAAGVDSKTGSSLSGHGSMAAYERYAHTVTAAKRQAVAQIAILPGPGLPIARG